MKMFNLFFYYAFYCSAVLFYGIATTRTLIVGPNLNRNALLKILSAALSTLLAIFLSYFLCTYILLRLSIISLYPLFSFFILLLCSFIVKMIIRLPYSTRLAEFSAIYLVVLLALAESTSVGEALLIGATCMLSFVLLLLVLQAMHERMDILRVGNSSMHLRISMLYMLVLCIIALTFWNVSWLR